MSDYKYYTPVTLFDALLEVFPCKKVDRVIDISCGSFNLLTSAQKKYPDATYIGVDIEEQVLNSATNISFFRQDGRLFAIQQKEKGITYDLILTNPPFGKLSKNERLFENETDAMLCSRYECEMMYANTLLANEGSRIFAILPATFVEGDLYLKYRKKLAVEFEINALIKLPENAFSKGEINAYVIILTKNTSDKSSDTYLGNAIQKNSLWQINIQKTLFIDNINSGEWCETYKASLGRNKKNIISIYRGNISSAHFTTEGVEILHCSSIYNNGQWVPLQCYCNTDSIKTLKYVHDGDILINRIGKNAGFWMKYRGHERLISDCLIVVHGGDNIESYLQQHSFNGRLNIPLKGVATKYISISDLLKQYFTIPT